MLTHIDNISPVYLPDPVNRQHPLNQGRIGWWLALPEISGGRFWYDLMGLSHGAVVQGASGAGFGWKPTARPGGYGDIRFDGAGGSIDCGASDRFNFTSQNFSLSFWLLAETLTNQPVVINRGTFLVDGWYIFINSSGQIELQLESSGADHHAISNNTVVAGSYDHFTIVRASTTAVKIYKNGVSVFVLGNVSDCANSTAPLVFGRYITGSANNLRGRMDDISIWGRALSATEAMELYNLSRRGYPGVLNRWQQRTVADPLATVVPGAAFLPGTSLLAIRRSSLPLIYVTSSADSGDDGLSISSVVA